MLGITLLSALITICNSYLISRLSSAFAKELRSKVVKKVMSFSNEEFEAMMILDRDDNDLQAKFYSNPLSIIIKQANELTFLQNRFN